MKSLFIFLLMLGTSGLFAFQIEESWYPGKVKLVDGTELMGDINYDLSQQMARVRINGQITNLKEQQLISLVIFIEQFWHEFQNVPLKNEQGEVSHTFARRLYRGRKKYSLFKEYYAVAEDFNNNPTTGNYIKKQRADLDKDIFMPDPKLGTNMDYRFFLADSEGNSLSITEKGLSKAYGECYKKVKSFVTRNRLTVKEESHVVRIIRYADSLNEGCRID